MDRSTLRRMLECPICFRLPRAPVQVLVCQEGHSLCSACYERLPKQVCPQGRCDFSSPPQRNRTAEAMLEEADFELGCKNADDGCDFEGDRAELRAHEAICRLGKVPCIEGGACKARLSVDKMTSHLSSSHPSVVFLDPSGGNTSTQKWLLKRKTHLSKSSCCWNTVVWEPRNATGLALAIRFVKREGVWYSFVVAFGDETAAEGLSCEVGVAGRVDLVYLGKVHPAHATTDEIVSSGACLVLSNEEVKDLSSGKGISQASLKAGFDAQLSVSYTIIPGGKETFSKWMGNPFWTGLYHNLSMCFQKLL